MADQFWKTTHGEGLRAFHGCHGTGIYRNAGSMPDLIDEDRMDIVWEFVAPVEHWKQGRSILMKLADQPSDIDPIAYIKRAAARKRGEHAPEPQPVREDRAFAEFLRNQPSHW